jgi:hypothetical protein
MYIARSAVQIPIGIAIATLIDIIAKATERTTAKAAIASEAATALVRREEATGAKRPPNHPLEPRDRIIVGSPQALANHQPGQSFTKHGQDWGKLNEAKWFLLCDIEALSPVSAARIKPLRFRLRHRPRKPRCRPWLQSRVAVQPAATRRGSTGTS